MVAVEQREQVLDIPEDVERRLERLLTIKEPRLPSSIRRYIRELKQSGDWDGAIGVRREEIEKAIRKRGYRTKEDRAKEELDRTVREILETDDPQFQAESEIKAIWLLNISGAINQEERIEDLLGVLDSKTPKLKDYLEGRLAEIRDESLKV